MEFSNTELEQRNLIIHVCLTESQKERQVEMVLVLVNTITSRFIGIDGVHHQYPNLTPSPDLYSESQISQSYKYWCRPKQKKEEG